jgi:tetratricopeptide (TPR) repeat protein
MKKISSFILLVLVAVMVFGAVTASASEPYVTYTYSIDGEPLESPTAYRAEIVIDSSDMNIGAYSSVARIGVNPKDVTTDDDANVYIADMTNNRIVVLNKYYKCKGIIDSFVDEYGNAQRLAQPEGVFVHTSVNEHTGERTRLIYICDTENYRIVVFRENDDGTYSHERTLDKPDTPLVEQDAFKPIAIAVDLYGRIFVVCQGCYEGVIVMSSEGDFTGFVGVQKVTYSLIDMIWRRFQTAEERASAVKNLADPYNNITVDEDGFVYVTMAPSTAEGRASQYAALKSKDASASPIKKLNAAGNEIMKRNGFFDPSGEVDILGGEGVSTIVDVAVGKEGSWTLLDRSRSRTFTYDQNGNLLFAFGDEGEQLGNIAEGKAVAIAYQNINDTYNLLLLDNDTSGVRITVYSPTPYYDTIISALKNQNDHNYSESIFFWQDVLTQNNNFDLAYIGIGKALFNQGKFGEAQEMLESAYETDYHDKAFTEGRKAFIQKWLLPMVIAIIVVIVLILKFLGYAKKKNKAVSLKVGKKTYWEELIYVFHLVFHPFDGFWDLKHEKRGSVRAALTFMLITIAAFFYQAIGQGYSFNPRGDYSTVFIQIISVVVPVALWCVGNWCLTTLFDGEGSFKDIVIATGYSLAPLPIFVIISTILTNVMTLQEGSMVNLLVSIGYVWVFFLLFFGTMVTHDYSMGKNFITILGTIVAMAIIIFVIVLFSSLVAKMVSFVIAIVTEIANRA